MANLCREYCAYFGEATEVWKRYVISEITVAFDEYRDSVCQTLQDAANSGANASTGGGQDINNQEEMFGVVLENAQQQAEQRIVNAMNQTLNQPPGLPSPVVSIFANQTAHVNPPGESAISQSGTNSGKNDGDDEDSLDVSIKSEYTDDEEVQVKEEPAESEISQGGINSSQFNDDEDSLDVSIKSEDTDDEEVQVKDEQTENGNNSNDNRETNDSQKDNSNEAENEQVSEGMMIDGGEAKPLEEDSNGPIIIAALYSSPPSSPVNVEQSIHSSEFNSRSNPENQINMGEDIASDNENDHSDAEDDDDGNLEDEHVDDMEIEENYNENSMIDQEENAGKESDHFEDQVNMSGIEDNDEESTDHTTDDDDTEEKEQAAGPSTSTGRRSALRVSKRQTVPNRQSKRPINAKKAEPLRVITLKLKCTVPGCKKVVKSKSALNSHFLSAHKLKRYRCLVRRCHGKVCTSFATKAQLSDHLDLVHGRTTRLACHCSKKFKSYPELCTHNWWYHQRGIFACSKDDCTFKPTSTRAKVLNHQYNHLEAKYACPVDGCDWSFKKKSRLARHTLTHTGDRPFACPECDKSFPLKSTLTSHLRAHRNDKCYRCTWPQCTYSSTERGNVLRHIRVVHFQLPRTKTQQAQKGIEDDRDPRVYLVKD